MKTKKKNKEVTKPVEKTPSVPLEPLHIVSAGLMNGKWGIVLSNGQELYGVEEINSTKPAYSDGYWITAKIFIPVPDKPITKEA